jgi:hypothetical protein
MYNCVSWDENPEPLLTFFNSALQEIINMNNDDNATKAGMTAGGGTVGAIGVTTAGASAAEITAALAAAGSLVGGGMAAGVCVVAATPLVVGYGVKKLWDWLTD